MHYSRLQPNIDSWPWQQNTCRVFYAMVLCKYVTRAHCVSTFKYLPANGKYAQWLVRDWRGPWCGARARHAADDQAPSWAAPLPCLRVPSSVPGGVSPDRNIATCSNTKSGNPGKTSSAFWTMSRSRRKMRRSQNTQKSRSQGGKRRERKVSHESGLCLLLYAFIPIIIMITHRSWWIHRSSIMWAPEGSFVWESNNLPHESIF